VKRISLVSLIFICSVIFQGCARTEIVESPKTGFVAETAEPAKRPAIVWTSRTLTRNFDYLGLVKSRSWTYDGALERLVDGAQSLRADAIIDVHFERVGFLSAMQAFAIKYK
jgi:hypothetical protein